MGAHGERLFHHVHHETVPGRDDRDLACGRGIRLRDLNRGLGGVQVEAVNHRRNSSRRHDAEGPFIDLELRLRDVRVGNLFYTYGNSHRTRCPSGLLRRNCADQPAEQA